MTSPGSKYAGLYDPPEGKPITGQGPVHAQLAVKLPGAVATFLLDAWIVRDHIPTGPAAGCVKPFATPNISDGPPQRRGPVRGRPIRYWLKRTRFLFWAQQMCPKANCESGGVKTSIISIHVGKWISSQVEVNCESRAFDPIEFRVPSGPARTRKNTRKAVEAAACQQTEER